MNKQVNAVLIGAGNRGRFYGRYALENKKKLRFTAVAEPIDVRLDKFSRAHQIPSKRRYKGWKDLLSDERLADSAFICTQDQMHTEATVQALEKGYHVLLEKPMASTLEDCIKIVRKAEETSRYLAICHVLRYTDFFSTIYNIIRDGGLGDIININHCESIAWYHFSHSYVRGEWANSEQSSPIILAKCCHDLDLLYWMIDSKPKIISSFGNLLYFNKDHAPENAPKYCVQGCPIEDKCLYYAPRIYIDIVPIIQIVEKSENRLFKSLMYIRKNHKNLLTFLTKFVKPLRYIRYWQWWPVTYLYTGQTEDYSDEAKWNILKRSPYGRCVFQSNNNVVDHQLVNIEFKNGVSAHLTLHGFSEREGRFIRIDGTKATLIGNFSIAGEKITLFEHYSGKEKVLFKRKLTARGIPHGGGDFKLVDAFLESLKREKPPLTNAHEILESHLMAFAAEESRIKGNVIDMDQYRKKLNIFYK
jgi:predicted dehydrogenase